MFEIKLEQEPAKKKYPKKRNCAVEGCRSNSSTDKDIVFHTFPAPNQRRVEISCEYTGNIRQVDQLEAWKRKLQIKAVTPGMFVCSKHFANKDYFFPDVPTKKRLLRKTAVPALNLPSTNFIEKASDYRSLDRLEIKASTSNMESSNRTAGLKDDNKLQDDLLKKGYDVTKIKLPSKDFGVQVNEEYKFFKLIKNDQQLSTATGIESFEAFQGIVERVKLATENKYEGDRFSLKTEDRVLMTYVKLKQKCSYSFLALIFNVVTSQHCRTVYLETAKVLSHCMKMASPWPSKNDQLVKNISVNFEDFEDM